MRTYILICLLLALPSVLFGALSLPPASNPLTEPVAVLDSTNMVPLSRQALETKLGRKLKFSERLVLGVLKRKVKRKQRRQQRNGGPLDGIALGSFLAGVLTLILLIVNSPVSLILGLVALILGIVGLGRFKRNPEFRTGKGLAIAGLVIGGGLLLLFVIALGIILATFG